MLALPSDPEDRESSDDCVGEERTQLFIGFREVEECGERHRELLEGRLAKRRGCLRLDNDEDEFSFASNARGVESLLKNLSIFPLRKQ